MGRVCFPRTRTRGRPWGGLGRSCSGALRLMPMLMLMTLTFEWFFLFGSMAVSFGVLSAPSVHSCVLRVDAVVVCTLAV